MPPAAPVRTMRRALASGMLLSLGESAIALQGPREVVPHGPPRLAGVMPGNAGDDPGMLVLDAFEVGPPLGRRVHRQPHALAWNDVAAQETQETRELAVAGRLGDGSVKGEVLLDRPVAVAQSPVDRPPGGADRRDLAPRAAF